MRDLPAETLTSGRQAGQIASHARRAGEPLRVDAEIEHTRVGVRIPDTRECYEILTFDVMMRERIAFLPRARTAPD